MATASGLTIRVAPGVYRTKWTISTSVSVGRPFSTRRLHHATIQVFGTFATKGDFRLQGSNNLATETITWSTLKDWNGTNITGITANTLVRVGGAPNLYRPILVSGALASGTSLTVLLETHDLRES